MALYTLGHGTANAGRLAELLRRAQVAQLVDVRREPGSRRNPDVARDAMARWLPDQGVGYRWDVRLGGRRPDVHGAPDIAPPHRSLVGYAAHMRTAEFRAAMAELLGAAEPTAVLCSEGDWRRCHRRMIADFAELACGVPVRHLLHDGRVAEHVPTGTARLLPEGLLVYDGGQGTLL
jgi:uncharacterized protein (DUF488 family)